jgi:probable phosphoglycerate mutase
MNTALNIIMYVLAIVGGIVSVWQICLWLKPYKKVSWRQVAKGILKLRDDLINTNYFPTLIIGIGRGGSVTGALLSGSFGNIPIIVIDRVYEWKDQQRNESFLEDIRITKNLERVLIVAGELHSGNTMKKYIAYFNSLNAGQIKTLAFLKEPFPTFNPDFYYRVSSNGHIRLPWMLTEHYKHESQIDYTRGNSH